MIELTPSDRRLKELIDEASDACNFRLVAIYAGALDDAIYARIRQEATRMVNVPIIGTTRDEQPAPTPGAPPCPDHGQPMMRGKQDSLGNYEWLCICPYPVEGPSAADTQIFADRSRWAYGLEKDPQ